MLVGKLALQPAPGRFDLSAGAASEETASRVNDRLGSKTEVGSRLSLVRSSLNNGHAGAAPSCPFGAAKLGHDANKKASKEKAAPVGGSSIQDDVV